MEFIDRERLTPMMQHYLSIKDQHPDCIIMYRLGDFYEMFFEDAKTAARILELALTTRECGLEERAPMCGVPHHVIESYIPRLVEAGKKVAIVEQMEDPKLAQGLVKRSVTRIITPGTLTDAEALDQSKNNFLLSVFLAEKSFGLCYTDLSTGETRATEEIGTEDPLTALNDWITSLSPSELVITEVDSHPERWRVFERRGVFLTMLSPKADNAEDAMQNLRRFFSAKSLRPLVKHPLTAMAASALFDYVYTFQEEQLQHLNSIEWVEREKLLGINASTRENLELHYNLNDRTKRHSLLWVLDHTVTAMGSRLLNRWLELPLTDPKEIESRLNVVESLFQSVSVRLRVRELLDNVYDLERLLGKLAYNRGNARDLLSLASSLRCLPELKAELSQSADPRLQRIGESIDPLQDLYVPIVRAIREDAPIVLTEGNLIRSGYSEKLDQLRNGGEQAREALIRYEESERERTGIKNLRVVFKRNVGYFIEITNSYLDRVPENYRRRQTLKNAERFLTDELELQAARILGDEKATFDLEYQLFQELRKLASDNAVRIQQTALVIARLDALASFAHVAEAQNYCRPVFSKNDTIDIRDGRHPVVECSCETAFIPNDTILGEADNRIQIITGPNMAGKSTYMRQVALILIMAQIGSFVPASSCCIPITDRIFTRIGATDNLARGDSTFMVEMKEMAGILQNATKKSFLVLDEVGRGTSTNDGLSIAYAILEYLSSHLPAKTLFATHYHELTALADRRKNIANRKVDIQENDGHLVFLRKVIEGKADKSYGIEVARLSGLPDEILARANYILRNIDAINDVSFVEEMPTKVERQRDFSDFQKDVLLQELCDLSVDDLRPIDALNKLHDIVERCRKLEM